MEFTNEFRVPSDIDTTFATLTDLEKVAPCLPGAVLEEVEGDTYRGRVKVKVGPVQVTYRGTATLAEKDEDAKRGRIEAAGKETRGAGTANADVVAELTEDGEGTLVKVVTDLNITGKVAQFGRGVMAEVGTKIIDSFADRLRAMLEEGEQEPAAEPETAGVEAPAAVGAGAGTSGAPDTGDGAPGDGAPGDGAADASADAAAPGPEAALTGAAAAGPRRIEQDPSREDDALDLMEVAGAATAKRMIPLVAALAAVLALVWWWRNR